MRLLPALPFLGVALLTPAARAQDIAVAETLFNRGLELMEAGDYEKGCPSLAESYRLDPRPGALFTLAECELKRGRIVSAYARYGEYLAVFEGLSPERRQKQQGRDKIARDQRAALAPKVPLLTLLLAPSAPRGTVVKRDDLVLGEPSLGVALPVEPGEHTITVQPPGVAAIVRRVVMQPGEKKQILLDDKPAPDPPRAPPPRVQALPPPPAKLPAPLPPEPARGPSGRRVAAYVAGGVGLAGLAVGGVLGGLALEKKGFVRQHCGIGGDPSACNAAGKAAGDSANALALGSTVAFAVGGAAVATAVVLFVTEPRPAAAGKASARWLGAGVLEVGGAGATAGVRGGF
jgi:hypothetical protein